MGSSIFEQWSNLVQHMAPLVDRDHYIGCLDHCVCFFSNGQLQLFGGSLGNDRNNLDALCQPQYDFVIHSTNCNMCNFSL